MLLTACGGQQTSTNIPGTNVPPVTLESTSMTGADMTTTPEGGSLTTTPGVPVTGAENPSRLSNELKFSVVDQSGNKLGDVKDMVLDLDNTRVSYVAVGSGGVLDIGEKTVLIPWDSVELQTAASSTTTSSAENAFVLQADPQVLQNAPTTDLNSVIPAIGQAAGNWDADIQSYWLSGGSTAAGTPSARSGTATEAPTVNATSTSTTGTGSGTAVSTATATSSSNSTPGAGTGTGNGQGQGLGLGQAMPLQGVMLASQAIGTTISLNANAQQGQGQGQGQGVATAVATSTTGSTGSSTATPSANATANATSTTTGNGSGTGAGTGNGTGTGTGVGNLQAAIADMIVETNTGMIQFLVVKTDLGNGDVFIPIPLNLIQWDVTNNAFVINTSANTLQKISSPIPQLRVGINNSLPSGRITVLMALEPALALAVEP